MDHPVLFQFRQGWIKWQGNYAAIRTVGSWTWPRACRTPGANRFGSTDVITFQVINQLARAGFQQLDCVAIPHAPRSNARQLIAVASQARNIELRVIALRQRVTARKHCIQSFQLA